MLERILRQLEAANPTDNRVPSAGSAVILRSRTESLSDRRRT